MSVWFWVPVILSPAFGFLLSRYLFAHGTGYKGPREAVIDYQGEIEDGFLRMRCTLGSGKRLSLRIDKATVYQMSNDMLIAAAKLGAKHPNDGRTEISDPALLSELKRRGVS